VLMGFVGSTRFPVLRFLARKAALDVKSSLSKFQMKTFRTVTFHHFPADRQTCVPLPAQYIRSLLSTKLDKYCDELPSKLLIRLNTFRHQIRYYNDAIHGTPHDVS
jgi:hypothetical protein